MTQRPGSRQTRLKAGGLRARGFNQFGAVGGLGRRATEDRRRNRMDETVVTYVDDAESSTGV